MEYKRHSDYPYCLGKSWKDFQGMRKKSSNKKKRRHHMIFRCCIFFVAICATLHIFQGNSGWAVFQYDKSIPEVSFRSGNKPASNISKTLDKNDIQKLLTGRSFLNLQDSEFDVVLEKKQYHVETTIDSQLQNFILNNLDIANSRYIGIVVMKPVTGKIISMVSFDRTNPEHNSCLNSQFPAASVFKIVTAAAAIEQCGFNSESTIAYSGQKYTLYKSQIAANPKHRNANLISFLDSFAQSINPVFGKIGAHYLEKRMLEDYAQAFGFNRKINFEIPFDPSFVSITEEPYHRAEIASGFNRETTISSIHGALMASVVQNQGKLVEPVIIDRITNSAGEIVYRSKVTVLNQAITPKASKIIEYLMEGTVHSGTGKRFFSHIGKDDILSKLVIGGKTGSINSRDYDARFDWFVGFASEKEGNKKIALSVVVAHEKLIGTRSGQYARMIIEEYFKNSIR